MLRMQLIVLVLSAGPPIKLNLAGTPIGSNFARVLRSGLLDRYALELGRVF
jgi:hypothetical protein